MAERTDGTWPENMKDMLLKCTICGATFTVAHLTDQGQWLPAGALYDTPPEQPQRSGMLTQFLQRHSGEHVELDGGGRFTVEIRPTHT
jgi:hypothetical protein